MHCLTHNGTGLVREGEPQDLILDYKQLVDKKVVVEDVFTFREDPVITGIYPLESFIE